MLRTFRPTLSLHPSLILGLTVLGWALPAAAQDSNAALAESLFRDGKRLSAEHKFAEACPKFAESYKLDPGLGTLLNLATCHEAEGKPASAWAEFSEASSRARRESDNERAQLAEEHVRTLEPKLAHISIALAGATPQGLVIKFDGRELSSAALGVQFPIDPGQHQVEASAPGKQSYSLAINAPGPAGSATVTVPPLQDAPGAAASAPVSATPGAPTAAPAAPVAAAAPSSSGPSHTAVIASGVATGLFLVGAVTTGIIYSGDRSSFNTANSNLDSNRFDKRDSAATMGTVNLVFSAGTLVSAGLLVYFLATQSSQEAAPATARLQMLPFIATNGGGIEVRGAL